MTDPDFDALDRACIWDEGDEGLERRANAVVLERFGLRRQAPAVVVQTPQTPSETRGE